MKRSTGAASPGWQVVGFVGVCIAAGVTTFYLGSIGLAVVCVLVLLSGGVIWLLEPRRMEILWVIIVVSFVFLPFGELRVPVGPLSVPIPAFLCALAMGILCVRFLATRDLRIEDRGIFVSLGLVLLANALSLTVAKDLELGMWTLAKWSFHAMLLVFLMSMRERVWHLRAVLALILVTGALSAYGLFDYLTIRSYDLNFYAGVGTRTATGLHLSLVLPLAVGMAMVRRFSLPMRLLLWAATGISATALVFTFSRTAWLSMLAALLVLGMSGRRVAALSLFGIGLIYLGYLSPVEVQERFWSTFSIQESRNPEITNALRLRLQSLAIKVISEHPIRGVGLANFALQVPWYLYTPSHQRGSIPFNFYLAVWAEGGVFAFLGFLGMLFLMGKRVFRGLSRATDGIGDGVLRGLLGAFMSLLIFFLFSDDFNNIVVWTILGLVVSGARLWTTWGRVEGAYAGAPHVEDRDRGLTGPDVARARSIMETGGAS